MTQSQLLFTAASQFWRTDPGPSRHPDRRIRALVDNAERPEPKQETKHHEFPD